MTSKPLGYVEHGGGRGLGQPPPIDGPQPIQYPEEGALPTAVGTCDEEVHPGPDLGTRGGRGQRERSMTSCNRAANQGADYKYEVIK